MVCANKYDDGFYKWFNNRTYILVMMGMTEKRFVKTHKTINWWAVLDNGKELLEDEVVELLNELHEKNQKLEVQLDTCLNTKLFSRRELEKENEQLKEENKELKVTEGEMEDYLARMEEENKELKQQLQREHTLLDNAIHLERTRMGKNSLKQYKEAIM